MSVMGGLALTGRKASGYRLHSDAAVMKRQFILMAEWLGFHGPGAEFRVDVDILVVPNLTWNVMSALTYLCRSALLGLALLQATVLPQGGCCCSVQRLMVVMCGGNADQLPACCRLQQAERCERSCGVNSDRLVNADDGPSGACHCVRSACVGPPGQVPSTFEPSFTERFDQWVAALPVLVTPLVVEVAYCDTRRHAQPEPLQLSGQQACIVLQSWRC